MKLLDGATPPNGCLCELYWALFAGNVCGKCYFLGAKPNSIDISANCSDVVVCCALFLEQIANGIPPFNVFGTLVPRLNVDQINGISTK